MSLVKSLQASFFSNCFTFNHSHYFNCSAVWGFYLDSGVSILEQNLWQVIGSHINGEIPIDEGYAKQHGEFIVYGNAYAPKGKKVTEQAVEVEFCGIKKQLLVTGDRVWQGALASHPEPFNCMEINYTRAFGSKNYLHNHMGIGHLQGSENLIQVPNIEYPNNQQLSSGKEVKVAGFSALDSRWQTRKQYMGTYDEKYIQNEMPGLASDTDFRFFNCAPEDQQIEGYFKGNEAYRIVNMHPELHEIKGHLPDVIGRCFIQQKLLDAETVFKEVPLKLDTVYFFPSDNIGIVIHRGAVKVSHPQAKDIQHILLAHENKHDNTRTLAHYQQELQKRTDPEHAWKYLLNTTPLIPIDCVCGSKKLVGDLVSNNPMADSFAQFGEKQKQNAITQAEQVQHTSAEKLKKTITELEDKGQKEQAEQLKPQLQLLTKPLVVDLNAPLPENSAKIKTIADKVLPEPDKLKTELNFSQIDFEAMDELQKEMSKQAAQSKINVKDDLKNQIIALKEKAKMLADEAQKKPIVQSITQLESAVKQMDEIPILPRFDLEIEDSNTQMIEAVKKQKEAFLAHPDIDEKMKQQVKKQLEEIKTADENKTIGEGLRFASESYLMGAHFSPESRSPHEGEENRRITQLLVGYKQDNKTPEMKDIAFGDISDQQLQKLQLIGGYLEYCKISRCNFDLADLSKAVFAHARIHDCSFSHTKLECANLGACQISLCIFNSNDFNEVTFAKSQLKNCTFNLCKFGERMDMWLETEFTDCVFKHCDFSKFNFIELTIINCTFENCIFIETNFVKGKQTGCRFIDCELKSTNFIIPDMDHSAFIGSKLNNVRFVGGANLEYADFSMAHVIESNLRDAKLNNAVFSGATLNKTDFGDSKVRNANFDKVIAIQTQFMETDLQYSSFKGANLMEASLMQANICGCDFSQANLYSASFINATLGQTKFKDAILTNTILQDWRP